MKAVKLIVPLISLCVWEALPVYGFIRTMADNSTGFIMISVFFMIVFGVIGTLFGCGLVAPKLKANNQSQSKRLLFGLSVDWHGNAVHSTDKYDTCHKDISGLPATSNDHARPGLNNRFPDPDNVPETNSLHIAETNPANGMPMIGTNDVLGNFYGSDVNRHTFGE